MSEVRLTAEVRQVLDEFLARPAQPLYGYDLMRRTGLPSGKLYPVLARLERAGWLARERGATHTADRPPRYRYRLSSAGAAAARTEIAVLRQQASRRRVIFVRLHPQGGRA